MSRPRRRSTDTQPPPWRLIIVTAVCSTAITAALFVAGYALAARTVDIQESRRQAIVDACTEQNERHDSVIETLDRVLDQARVGATALRREQIEQSRTSTLLLIDALAPKRQCEQRAAQLTR